MKNSKQFSVLNCLISLLFLFAVSCSNNPSGSDNGGGSGDYSHTKNPGISANDFLSDDTFTEVIIEIDYMLGYKPNEQAFGNLQGFLEQRMNKTTVTIMEPSEIESSGQSQYKANDIRNLEEEHRDEYTEGKTLTAYMIFVDGEYAQTNVLGIAYYNTSTAFFGPALDQASSGFGSPSRTQVESTVFNHEFGHLYGLVNIDGSGTDMQTDHQDEEHGHHCDNENCLMYYAMERPDLISQFFGSSVAELDENCIADLQANGGK